MPKERVVETKEGLLQVVLEEPKETGKITETIKVAERQKLATVEQKPSEKELQINKLLKQIENWKKLGYNTAILELEIKALDDKELRKLIERLKEWKSKGYSTLVLEEKIKSMYGYNKKFQDTEALELKIEEWKKKGYNTLLIEEKLKRLKK